MRINTNLQLVSCSYTRGDITNKIMFTHNEIYICN